MLMLVSGLEVTGFASNLTNNTEVSFDNIESEKPNIENEIISKRTAYSKVFSTDDGGYYSVVSATPIHIKDENGKFQNIEEPLVELSTEEAITEFVVSEAELLNETNQFATLSHVITDEDKYAEPIFIIKCIGSSFASSTEYFVQGTGKGSKNVYIKPNIAQENVLVTSAKINANALGIGTTSNNYVLAHEITSSWDENSTSQPTKHVNYFDCVSVVKSTVTNAVEWDITHLMNSWLLGLKENNGVVLTTKKKNCDVSLSQITLNYYYREIDEVDNRFTYETVDMGNAGTVYINNFSCIPILKFDDIGIDGEKSPVQISHTYDPMGDYSQNSCGDNFRINYSSILRYTGNLTYNWSTIDGKSIDFILSNTTDTVKSFTSISSNPTYTLNLQKNSESENFEYRLFENITIQNDYSNETFTFESHSDVGYLNSINDNSENNNTTTIYYTTTENDEENDTDYIVLSNSITSIVDGSGRRYVFNYSTADGTSYLESIDVLNDDDSPIYVGSNGDAEPYRIEYSYQIRNNTAYLESVTRVGEANSSSYSYDSQNRLSTISNGHKTLTLTYSDTSNKLTSYTITNSAGVTGEHVSIDSSKVYRRVFTNDENQTRIIHFDENYEIVYYKDYDGTITYQNSALTFSPDLNNNSNLISNGDFEVLDDDDFAQGWIIDNTEAEIHVDERNEINNNTLEIEGIYTDSARIYQQISAPDEISFKRNTSYVYGGTALADNAIATKGNHTFGIFIYDAVQSGDTIVPNECISYFNFNYTLNGIEQQQMSHFVLEEDTPALFVYVCFDYNYSDSAFFDDIQLYEFKENKKENVVLYEYEHDNENNSVTSAKLNSKIDNSKFMGYGYVYNEICDYNYLSEIEDERGITTYYTYNPDNGRLVSIATGVEANTKNFQYTAAGLLSSVQQTVTNTITGNTVNMQIDYGYTDGMLSSVTHNGYGYSYTYDDYGNVTSISVSTEETPLASTTYENEAKHRIDRIDYANGDCIAYGYNDNNPSLITDIYINPSFVDGEDNSWKTIHYSYDSTGNLTSMIDYRANIKIECSDNSYTFTTLDNNTTIYQAVIDNNSGNTVENFNQFESKIDNTISPSVQTANDLWGTTISSSQTLNKVVAVYNDFGIPETDENGVPKTRVSETYTYEKGIKYDEFMRPTSNSILAQYITDSDNVVINSEENYTYCSDGNKETTLISSYRTIKSVGRTNSDGKIEYDSNGNVIDDAFIDLTYTYAYDDAGNIKKIELDDNISNTHIVYNVFKYDNANQLIFEYSAVKNSCICYSYDSAGNITEKRVYGLSAYDLTNETIYPDAVCEHYIFTYDETYRDRLVSISSSDSTEISLIEYDDLGNPLTYDVADGTFEWKGYLLAAFETNGEGNRYEYEYDANGLRTRKILYDKELVNESSTEYTYTQTGTIEYVWVNGILKGVSITNTVQNTNFFMNIIYDESGNAQGYVGITGTPYYFIRDPLGNITSIIAATDDVNIEVKYDAWGNPTFPQYNDDFLLGVVATFVCSLNPSTYKGYIYDFETGLYYCGSRYYSSEWSRFISMDAATTMNLSKGNIIATNPYTYCNNNPVQFACRSGYMCEQVPLENSNITNNIDLYATHTSYNKLLFIPSKKLQYLK